MCIRDRCKEVVKYGGDVTGLVPDVVLAAMKEKYRQGA